jgi:ATP-binding cassette subfamily B protein
MIPRWRGAISEYAFARVLPQSYIFFHTNLSGTIVAKINDLAMSIPDLVQLVIDRFLTRMFGAFIAVYTLWCVNRFFGIATLLWTLFVCITAFFSGVHGRKLSDKVHANIALGTGHLVDVFSNISAVWFFNGTAHERKRYQAVVQRVVSASQNFEWVRFLTLLLFGISFIILQYASLYFLVRGRAQEWVTIGDFSLVMSLNLSIASFFWDLSRDFSHFAKHIGRISQSLRMLEQPYEIVDSKDARPLQVTQGEIEFDAVQFYYQGSEALFQNKTVIIKGGQKVGLVGRSGGGKTTFVNLILRLYDVRNGRILIDGQDIRSVTLESLRAAIAFIPQEPSLFHRSIRENIAYGYDAIAEADLEKTAQRAQIHEPITRLKNGYDAVIGESGLRLSGGEKQRVAIARAYLKKDAKIYILDEITSQLDPKNEAVILRDLYAKMEGKTTLIIAHRLSTLLYVDRILVFDQGKIVEDGSHEELLARDGLYKSLWLTQQGGLLHQDQADII